MSKKIFSYCLLLMLLLNLMIPTGKSFASEQTVRVTLPKFTVQLNGHTVENQYREYPLLVYKDITYLPMTWYDSRLLGLESKWTQGSGLNITKGKVTSSYVPYKTTRKNMSSYQATIPSFQITVNGEKVENVKEKYPLLSFNNIVYFPLTWKFAHDEFGWNYVWSDSKGLTIHSNNPQVKTVSLPISAEAAENDVALFKGYYYFTETVGNTNQVYRVPQNNTSKKELVYAYDLDSPYGFNQKVTFEIRDNELWFVYHRGGATMGSDVYCKVNDNGKATVEHQGYLDFRNTPNGSLIINQFFPPGGNNLSFVPKGETNNQQTRIGDPHLIYGRHINITSNSTGFANDFSTTIIGDDVYVLASAYPVENGGDINNIYKINLKTKETSKIINAEVSNFKVKNNRLYYVKDADQRLYSASLDGTNEQQLSDHEVGSWYDIVDGNVFYTVTDIKGQHYLYRAEPSMEDQLVIKEPLRNVQLVNDQLICQLVNREDYGVKLLDKSGNLQLAITDQVADVFAYDGLILLTSLEDKSIKLVK